MTLALIGFAILALLCLVGYRLEKARSGPRAREAASLAVRVIGDEAWTRIGESIETSFDSASAEPVLVSNGFRLRDEHGNTYEVPEGAAVHIRKIDGARRVPLAGITEAGALKPRVSFDVPASALLYTIAPSEPLSASGYRAGPGSLVEPGAALTLAGSEAALRAVEVAAFPGCWLMLLFPFVGGGLLLLAMGLRGFAAGVLITGLVLALVAFTALPKRPKPEARTP